MLAFLVCIVAVHQVHSTCVSTPDLCPQNATVQAEIVDLHNAFRKAVQPSGSDMLMMSYDQDIAAVAQAWVDQCTLAHGPPSTRMLNGYELGSNLFYSSTRTPWTAVISAWQGEVINYNYPTGSVNGKTVGHFTQVIWNSSYKVGCGLALCPNNIYFYSCNYYRAGNFKGWQPYSAGPACGSCPNDCVNGLCTNPCPVVDHFINCPNMKSRTGCSNSLVRSWCPASCTCTTEIIPIG